MRIFVTISIVLACLNATAQVRVAQDELPEKSSPATQDAEEIEFDTEFLDPSMVRGFDKMNLKKALASPAGVFGVEVSVNGRSIESMQVLFKEVQGLESARPCWSQANLKKLKLKTKVLSAAGLDLLSNNSVASAAKTPEKSNCLFINEIVDSATEKYNRNELVIELSIPQAAIAKEGVDVGLLDLSQGENVAFANYSASAYQLMSPLANQSSQFLSLNAGINLVPWQIRRSITFSKSADTDAVVNYGDFIIKRTLIDWKATLMLGTLSSQSQNLGGVSARGLRLSSEEQLMPPEERVYNPTVKGIARSNSRVQLKQNGKLFLEQNVPPGLFEFDDLRPPSNVGDIEVIVTDASGGQEQFYLPYSNIGNRLNPGSFRYSLMVGQYPVPEGAPIYLAQGGIRYGWNEVFTPELDYFLSEKYVAGATGFVLQNTLGSQYGSIAISNLDGPNSASGYSVRFGMNGNLGPALRLGFQRAQQSENYVDPSSALNYLSAFSSRSSMPTSSNALTASANVPSIGSFNLSYSSQDIGAQANASQNLGIGYSRGFTWFNVYANINQSTNNLSGNTATTRLNANIGLSIPLKIGFGGARITTSTSATEGSAPSHNIGYNGRWDENTNYGLSYGVRGSESNASFGADSSHPLGTSNVGVSQSSAGSTQLNIGNTGAVVLYRGGFLAGPSVGETFGILEVPGGENVRAQGERSRVNSNGIGLISNLNAFSANQIYLDLEKSNLDLELDSTVADVAPVSGSVVRVPFKSRVGLPLLLTFTRTHEIPIPMGAELLSSTGDSIGLTGHNNWALARVSQPSGTLTAKWGDKSDQSCKATFALNPNRPSTEASDETAIILVCKTTTAIPMGSEIVDSSGDEIAVTGQGGRALVRVKEQVGTLKVQWGVKANEFCEADYHLERNAKPNSNGLIAMHVQCR